MSYLVSILVPIYGVEQYIERCAVSLFEQTYGNIEYVFVDDCSPDKSLEILHFVATRYPNRIEHIKIIRHERNKGLATARNTAVAAANGTFVIHVDSDDWIDKNTVEVCVKKQIGTDADIILYGFKEHFSQTKCISKKVCISDKETFITSVLLGKIHPVIWNKMIRRCLYFDNGLKCLDGVNMGEDLQITPLLFYYSHKIEVIEEYLYHYNVSNVNAYTKCFSSKKAEQTWCTLLSLTTFFSDKGNKYIHSMSVARLNFIARSLINSAYSYDCQYFGLLRERLSEENKEYYKEINPIYRVSFYIKNIRFLFLYSVIMKTLKKMIRFIV